jgi:uncharacterized membrane protein YozB (DUF420 family)
MTEPLIARELLANLKLVHGGYNLTVVLLFLYQGWLGLAIRRARQRQEPLPTQQMKRHRKLGPIFAVMGLLGFLAGVTLILVDTGNILEYPMHFFNGVTIVLLLLATFLVSRQIRGTDPTKRNLHFALGITILCLYLLQVFLGIGALL